MKIIAAPEEFQRMCRARGDAELGFVPTMGALHAGHLALVRASRQRDARTAVSIFVNPTQFGPHEDLDRYPRTLDRDCALLEAEGVDWVFAPDVASMYPPGAATFVEVEGLSQRLDGGSRPGHFRGVATVVLKLFALAAPTRAYFGQKDAAQVAVLRRMARDLFLPLEIVVCPIVREPDGLALSSRNALLSPEERRAGLALSRALRAMGAAFGAGERACARLVACGLEVLAREPGLRLDFLQAVEGASLLPAATAVPGTLFAAAAFAGPVRLIDNAHVDAAGGWRL